MKQVLRMLAFAGILALTLTACGFGATATPPPVAPGDTPVVILPTAAPGDPCANEYLPVRMGATWDYASSGSTAGSYGFRKRITEVKPGEFSVGIGSGQDQFRERWVCSPDGLVSQTMNVTDSASLQGLSRFNQIEVTNIVGINLPPAITRGAQWSYSADIQGTQVTSDGTVMATMTAKLTITYVANGRESVTVAAGTYDAMAIATHTVIEFTINDAGGPSTLVADSTYTVWYAPGLGWVKSSGNGKLGGQDYFETIELQNYQIP